GADGRVRPLTTAEQQDARDWARQNGWTIEDQRDETEIDQQQDETGEPYELEAPADIPTHVAMEWDETRAGFSEAASGAGIPQSIAQGLTQSFIDVESAIGNRNNGVSAIADSADQCAAHLKDFWGHERYETEMKKVRRF